MKYYGKYFGGWWGSRVIALIKGTARSSVAVLNTAVSSARTALSTAVASYISEPVASAITGKAVSANKIPTARATLKVIATQSQVGIFNSATVAAKTAQVVSFTDSQGAYTDQQSNTALAGVSVRSVETDSAIPTTENENG